MSWLIDGPTEAEDQRGTIAAPSRLSALHNEVVMEWFRDGCTANMSVFGDGDKVLLTITENGAVRVEEFAVAGAAFKRVGELGWASA